MSAITETPIYDELRRTLLDPENEEEPAHGSGATAAEEATSETATSASGLSGTGVSTGRRSRRTRH
ncbi:MAG TPA: hypothetical protein VIL00_15130 [Pseudonocardiaceae bacterium]